jgi:hypothetical protein
MLKESAVFVLLIGFMISSAGLGPGFSEKWTPTQSPERFAREMDTHPIPGALRQSPDHDSRGRAEKGSPFGSYEIKLGSQL